MTEVSSDGLTTDDLEAEIKWLFRAAERTSSLWGTDLSKPLSKVEEKKADKTGFEGDWTTNKYWKENLPTPGYGLQWMTFADDGTLKTRELAGKTNNPTSKSRTGTYTVKGDRLTISYNGEIAAVTYTFALKDGVLTLDPDKTPGLWVITLYKAK